MDTIGLDLHKRESQLCIGRDDGTTLERRIATTRVRFAEVLGDRPRARILLEASTESEWVARHLEALGHDVIVADPNFAPMYAARSRRTKTDRRDARTLMEACRQGAAARVSSSRPDDVRTTAWAPGDADQAYFIRDTRAMIGVTPGASVTSAQPWSCLGHCQTGL